MFLSRFNYVLVSRVDMNTIEVYVSRDVGERDLKRDIRNKF